MDINKKRLKVLNTLESELNELERFIPEKDKEKWNKDMKELLIKLRGEAKCQKKKN
jgi:uncharacterized membrane protein YgaE (UPF0421/DUF939 family)